MYISSGGGSGKGSALPNQQSNSATTTPAAPHNAALQQAIYPQHIQSVVMPPAFHAQYIPRQSASQVYSSTPPIHFPQPQMPPNFTSYSYFFTNSLLPHQHRPSIIQSSVAHNPSHLALPSVNMIGPSMPPQASCQAPIHPPLGNNFPGKKRSHALPIINPVTKKNIMEEFELSKNLGLDSKQQTKSSETEIVSRPSEISNGLPQNPKLKKNSNIEESKEIVITEPHTDIQDLPKKVTDNVDKEEKLISTVKIDGAEQDVSQNCKTNSEIGREQPAQKEDVDTYCSNLENENRTKNQSSTNDPNGEQVSKECANSSDNKPICDKSVENVVGSQVNVAPTKVVKLQSTTIVERSIERKKHGVERQRKKSQSLENVEKRISDNSKKKNYREEELKRKDRVENKNVSTDISITRKSPESDDSKESTVLCPVTKEVKSTHPAEVELDIKIIASDKLDLEQCKTELVHSKEIKETSTDILEECAKPNVASSKTHSSGPSQNPSSFQIFYKDGQWSPYNLEGKKSYDLQQLHLLSNSPLSKVKPKLKKIIGVVNDTPKSSSSGRSYKNSHAFVNNNESGSLQSNNKSGSKIGTNQAKQVSKPNKPGIIHVRLALRENIKLSETENAWRPSHFKTVDEIDPTIREKEELFRKVRGILNKLTPEKFDALVAEIMKLQIDTAEKINGVMMLVFEKAIDEPNFSASYARLCQRVADKNAVCNNDGKAESKKSSGLVPFKTALLDKTEREFNVNVIDLHAKNAKLKPTVDELKQCNDSKKKQELQIILEEQEYLLRKRSCGTVRFIGELFKMSMLTGGIIKTCVYKLLDSKCEDKLECLCKLLTTVGKKFEKTPIGKGVGEQCLDDVICKMQTIVDRKVESTKVSNRVRFMLQDVIDLRRNNWITNHRSDPQKLLESLQNEQPTNTSTAYNSSTSKRGDRTYDSRASSHSSSEHSSRPKGTYACEESWFKHNKGSHMVDTNKLKPIFQTENMFKLGDSSHYQWRRDRASSTQAETHERFLTQVPDLTFHRMHSSSKAEETRHNVKKGLNSGLPSIPKSNSQTNIETPKTAALPKKIKSATTVTSALSVCPNDIPSAPMDISEKDNKLITDVLNRMVDAAEEESIDSCLVIWSNFSKKLHWALIYNIFTDYLHLRKVKSATRQILSKIILHLIHGKYLLLEDFEKGYLEFSKIANEIVIDVPEAWKYIFEFIGYFIIKETMSVRLFWNQYLIDMGMGKYFLKNCIPYFIREKGYNYVRNLWQSENLEWKQFLDERDVTKFIEDNKFQFLNSKENAEFATTSSSASSVIKQIKKFLQDNNSTPEDIMEYLNRNSAAINNEFVGNLSLALCESAVVRNLNNSNFNQRFFLKKCIPLLRRYIDFKEDNEISCLSTIADFAQGFNDADNLISGIFYELYEADVISEDSFLKWWNTKKQILEKRISLLGLSRFFNLFQYNTEASDEN